jgi:UDP-GlcNAc:undecaprenyl-phosphate/decaprenyl-phosphate GlcNAc-1-phosphate transferase
MIGISAPGQLGWVSVVLTFLIAAVAAWRFIPRLRIFALEVGWADDPSPRRLNKEPLPNAGGLAIFASVVLALVIATLLRPNIIEHVQVQLLAILLGGSVLIISGFIDDQFGLPPWFRLVVQLFAALLLVSVGIRFKFTFGLHLSTALSVVLTLIWIIGITNAMNLIDGVDGLAGGVTFISSLSLLAVAAQFSGGRNFTDVSINPAAAILLLAPIAGAALGFLRHNFPPSRIILGDSGAYFFGFVLAASSILGNLKTTAAFALFPASLFLLIPLLDTLQVILRRLVRRKNPLSTPGNDHIHHGLLARGFSQTRTTLILWAVTLVANLAAMIIQHISAPVIAATGVIIVLLLSLIVWRRRRAYKKAAARHALELPRHVPGTKGNFPMS